MRPNHNIIIALLGGGFRSLLVVRRDLRLGVDAFDQGGQERVFVHDGGGDPVETAFLKPNQPGHHGDVADRELCGRKNIRAQGIEGRRRRGQRGMYSLGKLAHARLYSKRTPKTPTHIPVGQEPHEIAFGRGGGDRIEKRGHPAAIS